MKKFASIAVGVFAVLFSTAVLAGSFTVKVPPYSLAYSKLKGAPVWQGNFKFNGVSWVNVNATLPNNGKWVQVSALVVGGQLTLFAYTNTSIVAPQDPGIESSPIGSGITKCTAGDVVIKNVQQGSAVGVMGTNIPVDQAVTCSYKKAAQS